MELLGTTWHVLSRTPPRLTADRAVAIALATRAQPPATRHLGLGLARPVRKYADTLVAWLYQNPDDDDDGYYRRINLLHAAQLTEPGIEARDLVMLAENLYEYMTDEAPPGRRSLAAL